jgi:hypothetical protein
MQMSMLYVSQQLENPVKEKLLRENVISSADVTH